MKYLIKKIKLIPVLFLFFGFYVSFDNNLNIKISKPNFYIFENDFKNLEKFKKDEVLVKLKTENRFRKVALPEGISVKHAIELLKNSNFVEYAEPNYFAFYHFVPNDRYYKYQWNFHNTETGGINLEYAWDYAQGKDVTIAVIDTGIAYENYRRYKKAPDFENTEFVKGYDFVNRDFHPNDDNGHGTHVAGTIAQTTNNFIGTAGIAFKAKIMPIKVLDRRGIGTYSDIAEAIFYAVDNGADIINLSLGGYYPSKVLEDALKYASQKGVLVIASAGNDGKEGLAYPAAYDDYVIAVGATRVDKTLTYYSNYGNSLDLVAPGGDLKVDQNNDGYKDGILQQTFVRNPRRFGYYFFQGTSMSAPHVTGVAALLMSLGLDSYKTKEILFQTAQDLGEKGPDKFYGYGLVDAKKAIEKAIEILGIKEKVLPLSNTENLADNKKQKSNENENKSTEKQKNYDIEIKKIYAFNLFAGKEMRIGIKIENNSYFKKSIKVKAEIYKNNKLLSWGNLGEKQVDIKLRREIFMDLFKVNIPKYTETGKYLLKISITEPINKLKTKEIYIRNFLSGF